MSIVCWLLLAYQLVVLVYIIAAWVPAPPAALGPVFGMTRRLVDPIVLPLRRRIPPVRLGSAALDSSILILIIGLVLLQAVFC
ncbi:MAG TPA: YggT family protein [Nitriliruptoraceae bacterium]|nr:YggT family protein [Nitriliruptoraceae bacterium]